MCRSRGVAQEDLLALEEQERELDNVRFTLSTEVLHQCVAGLTYCMYVFVVLYYITVFRFSLLNPLARVACVLSEILFKRTLWCSLTLAKSAYGAYRSSSPVCGRRHLLRDFVRFAVFLAFEVDFWIAAAVRMVALPLLSRIASVS